MSPRVVSLETGADARLHNEGAPLATVLVNGGTAREVPGTWSATSELLAGELAPRLQDVLFAEVRYRIKSWNTLPSCMADAEAALDLVARTTRSAILVGFSMGGAVSIGVAAHPHVDGVLGLAPWIPDRLSVDGLRGKRLDVLHGAWDRWLPGIPGVSPESSRAGFERALALGAEGTYELVPRGLHGCALRGPSGRLLKLPRWRAWVDGVAERLGRFQASASAEAVAMRLRSR
jgi:pimeloyl-ACP methyl ester carboxylesterase